MNNYIKALLPAFVFASLLVSGCDVATEPQQDAAVDAADPDGGALKAGSFGTWSAALDIESASPGAHENFNTAATEGCPFISRDGKTFFIASDRVVEGQSQGGLDIWISTRERVTDPWGEPFNPGYPINTAAADFCPTLARDGHTFFFASNRPASEDGPGYCGTSANADLYTTRWGPHGFGPVEHLGCEVNSSGEEHGPFPMTLPGEGPVLFFSSTRAAGPGDTPGDHDLYMSRSHGGKYQAPELVAGVNTEFDDGQPNVRRDGLELFFYSNRPTDLPGVGGSDIYSASRASAFDRWSAPVNLGSDVNSPESETRPSLSWDGHTLYFGSTRTLHNGIPSNDIFVTTR